MSDVEELLLENGYEGVKYLTDFAYDTALIGVSDTGCTVYDYEKNGGMAHDDTGFQRYRGSGVG